MDALTFIGACFYFVLGTMFGGTIMYIGFRLIIWQADKDFGEG